MYAIGERINVEWCKGPFVLVMGSFHRFENSQNFTIDILRNKLLRWKNQIHLSHEYINIPFIKGKKNSSITLS
jgi:hypothetical protein